MNGLTRIREALAFRKPDRVPVIAQVFGHAAVLAGVPLGQYLRDGALLARCQLQALAVYGYDAVFALMDVGVETEAVGSVLAYQRDQYPAVSACAVIGVADLQGLTPQGLVGWMLKPPDMEQLSQLLAQGLRSAR